VALLSVRAAVCEERKRASARLPDARFNTLARPHFRAYSPRKIFANTPSVRLEYRKFLRDYGAVRFGRATRALNPTSQLFHRAATTRFVGPARSLLVTELYNPYNSDMPAQDLFHDVVKNALIEDGWTITHDRYRLSIGQR